MPAIKFTLGRTRARRRGWVAAIAGAALGTQVLFTAPAQAQVPDAPARTWGVGPAASTLASDGKPRVLAILPVGDRIVVGGTFDTVIDPAGNQYPAKNLAVFSASTGAANLQFAGSANNTVTSLSTDGAGTLFVGGTFGTMNGVARKGLAALDVATGDLLPWAPSIAATGQVDALAYTAGAVYAGGNFSAVTGGSGTSKAFLAKVDAQSGAVDTAWSAAPNGRVRAVNVASDGSARLFIGGDFTSVSAKAGTNKIAAVFTATGALDTAFRAGPTNQSNYAPVFDLTSDGTRLYAAAAGQGGACTAQNAKTGATLWSDHTTGNLQSVRLSAGLLYCGGHFSGTGSFLGQTRYKVAAVDPATGSLNAFAPNVNSSQGVWTMGSDATRVYMGGDFSSISGVPQPHFAMFVDTAAQTTPKLPPSTLSAQASDARVQLTWKPASSDGGSALMKYRLYRSTTPGGQDLTKTPLATLTKTTLSYADTTVANGTTYYYVVVATNALGSSAPSNEASARPQGSTTVTPPGPPSALSATTPAGLIRLTWNAPTNTGGAPITSYRVYRGTTPGGEDLTTPVGTPTTTTFDDTAVTAGTAYSYVVTAVNGAGQGTPSSEVTATATAGTAGVPGQPVLSGSLGTGPSGGPAAVLQWTIPPDGGSPITKYVIIRDGVRLITLTADATGPTTYTDTTITSGQHVYQVKAANAIGGGPLSNKVNITAP